MFEESGDPRQSARRSKLQLGLEEDGTAVLFALRFSSLTPGTLGIHTPRQPVVTQTERSIRVQRKVILHPRGSTCGTPSVFGVFVAVHGPSITHPTQSYGLGKLT